MLISSFVTVPRRLRHVSRRLTVSDALGVAVPESTIGVMLEVCAVIRHLDSNGRINTYGSWGEVD